MNCVTKKRCYYTKEQAEDALLNSHMRYKYNSGTGPVNVYKCDYCGTYHFTSKGDKSSELRSGENKSKMKIGQEAAYWEDKWRKK